MFHNGQPNNDGDRKKSKAITFIFPWETLSSVALSAATLYQYNPYRKLKPRSTVSTPYACATGKLLDMNGKFTMENQNSLSCRKVLFLTRTYCQFLGVSLGMKQTFMFLVVSLISSSMGHMRSTP